MPKNRPMDGAKGRPRKAKMHTRTAKEAVQCMFSPVGTADTTMTENNTEEEASEAMQDVSENVSDMETDEQKKRESAPKQNMQETTTVTSDTASPEPKKTRNDHQDISQSPVKALFQTSKDQATLKKGPNKEARNTTTKVSTPVDEVQTQEPTISENGTDEGTQLKKVQASQVIDTTTQVVTDEAPTRQNTTNSEDQGTAKSSATEGPTNTGKVNLTRETVQLSLQDNASANDKKLHTKPPSKGHEGTTEKAQEE